VIYNLRIWAIGHGPGIDLAEAEYSSIVGSMHRIYLARDFEEKLDILLENLREYEQDLLGLALQSSLFRSLDDERVAVERQLVNRRTTNLLSSARMYVDLMQHSLSVIYTATSGPDAASLFAREYKAHLEYRTAEALRNFSQHRALPVHVMSWPGTWDDVESDSRRLRFSVVPEISLDELEAEGGFKASVLEDLGRTGKRRFPLTPILRQYVESLARVHEEVRAAISGQVERDHELVEQTLERARSEFGDGPLLGLAASKGIDLDHVDEHHFVNEKSWERRTVLMKKNSSLGKMSRRFVSAEYPSRVA
jgi:hypothetical protein